MSINMDIDSVMGFERSLPYSRHASVMVNPNLSYNFHSNVYMKIKINVRGRVSTFALSHPVRHFGIFICITPLLARTRTGYDVFVFLYA